MKWIETTTKYGAPWSLLLSGDASYDHILWIPEATKMRDEMNISLKD